MTPLNYSQSELTIAEIRFTFKGFFLVFHEILVYLIKVIETISFYMISMIKYFIFAISEKPRISYDQFRVFYVSIG